MNYVKRSFDGIELDVLLTGSTVYGFDVPNDVDYLTQNFNDIQVALIAALKATHGWTDTGEEFPDYPTDAFVSLRKGNINLIFGKTKFFVDAWQEAHNWILENPMWGRAREDRLAE